jgi:AP-2 complex subunit alpha
MSLTMCPVTLILGQGYLAITLLMHENSDLIRLVINSIRKDLDDMNEMTNCLALHAIANIGGSEMADSLAPDVHRLLISPWVAVFPCRFE